MPEPLNITNIPSNRVDFIDPRTGTVSREWYRFFLNLFTLAGSGGNQTSLDDLQIGPLSSDSGTSVSGSVTSVAMSVPTGLDVAGSPITTVGTFAVTYSAGYSIPTNAKQTQWDTAYAERAQWDGGATNLVAATGRTSLGATTVGSNFFTLANPTAITFVQINADNTITTMDAPTFRTAIGAGTGGGTVTSVSALTLGTTGTDLSSTVANGTTTPVITLNVPTASATNRGALSAADWSVFNAKQPAGTYVNSVSGTTGRITSTGGVTPVIDLTSGIATAGTTGSSTLIPVVTIDTYGRVTNITTAANPQGTVTSVTGIAPVASSGGATPAISLAAAYGDTLNPYASKTANFFLAAPNGVAGVPTFRAIVAADIPTLNQNTTGTASNVTGTVAIANGGTGQTAATAAFDALSPTTTKGDLIVRNGSNNIRVAVGTDTYVLTADSTTVPGVKWAAPASGNITTQGLWENKASITVNYSITSGNNAMSSGPISVASGVTVTVPSGSSWVIV